jgi:hypothetical protein
VAGALLLLAALAFLAGCQGVSAGSSSQAQLGTLSLATATLNFGSVAAGSSKTLSATATNSGPGSVTINSVAFSTQYFSLNAPTLPLTLTVGQSTPVSVTFSPNAAGTFTATATITGDGANTATLNLLGTGTGTGTGTAGQLAVTPTTLALGSAVVGNSVQASGTLTASGASVTVTAASASNAAFVVTSPSLPVTVPVGQSVPFTVTFTPAAAGAVSATLTFTSDAQPSTTTETLTGTGTAASSHTVNLSWNASTSPNISGYNIYRAVYSVSSGTCGSFSQINPTLNTSTLYTDSSVTDGTSYCYAATAVNSSQEESSYSNIVSDVQIPPT